MPNENREIAQAAFRKMQLIPISYLHTKYEGLIWKSFVGLTIDPKGLAEYNLSIAARGLRSKSAGPLFLFYKQAAPPLGVIRQQGGETFEPRRL